MGRPRTFFDGLLCGLVVLLACTLPSLAQQPRSAAPDLVATSSLPTSTGEYAWLLVRDAQSTTRTWKILAWPPSAGAQPRELAAPVEIATLDAEPDVVASYADRLYVGTRFRPATQPLGFPPPPSEEQRGTEVLMLRAFQPGKGRATGAGSVVATSQTLRSLPVGWDVRSSAASGVAGGTLVVLVEPSTTPGELTMTMLIDGAWRTIAAPFQHWPRGAALVPTPAGVGVLIPPQHGASQSTLWLGQVVLRVQPGPLPKSRPLMQRPRLPQASWFAVNVPGEPRADRMCVAADRIMLWDEGSRGEYRLLAALRDEMREPVWREVARVEHAGNDAVPAFFPGEGRSVLVWNIPAEKAQESSLRYVAVSTETGRMVEKGNLSPSSPIAQDEVASVAIVMAYIVGLVAVMIFRPSAQATTDTLPPGAALAEPLKRFLAGSIDLTIALFVGGLLIGWTTKEVFALSVSAMLRTGEGQLLLGAILGVGLVHGTLAETFLGRTLGKFVVGIDVVRARTKEGQLGWEKPGLLASLLRNGVKWLLPPLALLAIWSPAGRHRGELYARTFVVEAIDPEDEPEEG